jgi:hypothetical protein
VAIPGAERELLDRLSERVENAAHELERKAATVESIDQDRRFMDRWLIHTGFPIHLQGLRDTEIRSSFRLPKKRDRGLIQPPSSTRDRKVEGGGDGGGYGEGEAENDLVRILSAADALLPQWSCGSGRDSNAQPTM